MSITTNIEVDKVCRTCLLPSEDMKSLYEACSSAMQICVAEVLSKCTSLKMSVANDGLPTHICQDCLCKLNQAYNFVLKCRKSDDKLRNHLNKNINTSAAVQITHTDGICVETEEAAIINYLNTNVKLEVDLTLGISDLSIRQENVKTLEAGRCSGNDFKSPSLNDNFECINNFKISLREPLPISAIQPDLDQELVVIKHEIDCDVETEMQRSINCRNENIDVDRASVNLHENATEPCRQSSTLLPEIETKNKITSVHTEAKNTLSANSIEFKKSHNMNSVYTDEITSTQPENSMNMMNAVVILEDINLHLKSLRSPIQHQFEQLNCAASKSINKIAIIADTSSTRHKISQIRRDHQTFKINDQYCTKMPVKPYRVKRKNKCTAIYTTEETLKSTISRLTNHQVYIPYTCKFTCTVCEKCFNTKQELRCHTKTHTRESLSPPDGIVKSITRKESGPRHVKHMGDKSTVCKICEKTFIRKSGLNQHLLTHTGEKPHSCATCDRGFIQKGDLTRHMLIHTGERPYSCSVCDKTFTQKGSLTLHTFIHTGEKPYSCGTCDKKFIQKVDLTRHMLMHTGEKPYSCPNCDKTFTRKDRLTKHMLIEIDQRKCVNSG